MQDSHNHRIGGARGFEVCVDTHSFQIARKNSSFFRYG